MSHLKSKLSAPSPTPSNSSMGVAKRKRPDDSDATVVYSQPQETGTGTHIYTQFTYTITKLKEEQRWYKLEEILNYLNIPHGDPQVPQLVLLYRSPNPTNRIEYNKKLDMYRYRPKYNIRNEAELKGYLQSQKSALGLSVKELKDGWPNAAEAITKLEDNNEILVSHHKKDNQPKTVWINDASLMHKMDPEFQAEWHKIQLPANPDDLRNNLVAAGLKPASAPRKIVASGPKEKKRKAPRRGGKQTNTHMTAILKDFSHLRK